MTTRDFLRVSDSVLPINEADAVLRLFAEISIPAGSIFVECGNLRKRASEGHLLEGLIFRLLFRELASADPHDKVEFWVNRSIEVVDTVDYHVDNDEALRTRLGQVRMPMLGAIFYAGPSDAQFGGTYFNPPISESREDPDLFTKPQFADIQAKEGIAIAFKPNRLVVFDGRCPHCVIPYKSANGNPRIALLFNIWAASGLAQRAGEKAQCDS